MGIEYKRKDRNEKIQFILYNLKCIGIPKILFKTSIKLKNIAQKSNPFYKVRKVLKNRTKDKNKKR